MTNKKRICIAGKNKVAIEGMKHALMFLPAKDLLYICDKNDTGEDGYFPSYKKFCETHKIQETSLEEAQAIEGLIFISLEFYKLIKPALFRSEQLFNLHFSLLPAYKGMYTSCHPILRGEQYSGVTLHKIDEGIDTGDIIAQKRFQLSPRETAETLYHKYNIFGAQLLAENLENIFNLNFNSKEQPAFGSSYFSRKSVNYKSLKIDHTKTAYEVDCQYRAYTFRHFQLPIFEGVPICSTFILNSKSTLKPGSIVWKSESQICVSTIDYDILLDIDFYEMLFSAISSENICKIQDLIKKVPDINYQDNNGWTALIKASYSGQLDVINILLENGASPNCTNFKGTPCLMYALSHFKKSPGNDAKPLELLLKAGADLSAIDRYGLSTIDYIYNFDAKLKGKLTHLLP